MRTPAGPVPGRMTEAAVPGRTSEEAVPGGGVAQSGGVRSMNGMQFSGHRGFPGVPGVGCTTHDV